MDLFVRTFKKLNAVGMRDNHLLAKGTELLLELSNPLLWKDYVDAVNLDGVYHSLKFTDAERDIVLEELYKEIEFALDSPTPD